MSIFRTKRPTGAVPESPISLFRDLKMSGPVKFPWDHQAKVLDEYHRNFMAAPDVALELPTGTGKTLIGLLIAEFRRRVNHERVAYLCPTRQLANQAKTRADEYGVNASLLVGAQRDYNTEAFASFQRADAVAITTYSAIFNTNPRIDSPQVIVCDDAHSADAYISGLWELEISRREYPDIFTGLVGTMGDAIPENVRRMIGAGEGVTVARRNLVYLVPSPLYAARVNDVTEFRDAKCADTDLRYPWQMLRGHIQACSVYVSLNAFLIRPFIPPALTHPPYKEAAQRIFLSATLGEGGDLERAVGVGRIERIPVPPEWDTRGSGRRLILFPDLLGLQAERTVAIEALVNTPSRTLVLARDGHSADEFIGKFGQQMKILRAEDVEESLAPYISETGPVCLVLANRYDGIDLPDDACRRMIMIGLPSAANLQERFFEQKLRAMSFLRNRIRTRITQGIGRCTRNPSDYALALLTGEDLLKWCCTDSNAQGLHPELQAEMAFGIENSARRPVGEFRQLYRAFLDQGEDWAQANETIAAIRNEKRRVQDAVSESLSKSAKAEVMYTYELWGLDFDKAYERACAITELLNGTVLQPYRAYWHYLAAACARFSPRWESSNVPQSNFADHVARAMNCTVGTDWLAGVRDLVAMPKELVSSEVVRSDEVTELLEDWGIAGLRFQRGLGDANAGITGTAADGFNSALAILGRMLGCRTTSWSAPGAPDCLWLLVDDTPLIFEAKSDESPEDAISLRTVRQALTHANWIRTVGGIPINEKAVTVVTSPRRTVSNEASALAADLRYVDTAELKALFDKVAAVLSSLRARAHGVSEEELDRLVQAEYHAAGLDHRRLLTLLASTRLANLPKP
jgi:hypothetical protein